MSTSKESFTSADSLTPENEMFEKIAAELENLLDQRLFSSDLEMATYTDFCELSTRWEYQLRQRMHDLLENCEFNFLANHQVETKFKEIQGELKSAIHAIVFQYDKNPQIFLDHLARVLQVLFLELETDKIEIIRHNTDRSKVDHSDNVSQQTPENNLKESCDYANILEAEVDDLRREVHELADFSILSLEQPTEQAIRQIFIDCRKMLISKSNLLHDHYLKRDNASDHLRQLRQSQDDIQHSLNQKRTFCLNNISNLKNAFQPDLTVLKEYRKRQVLPRLRQAVFKEVSGFITDLKLEKPFFESREEVEAYFQEKNGLLGENFIRLKSYVQETYEAELLEEISQVLQEEERKAKTLLESLKNDKLTGLTALAIPEKTKGGNPIWNLLLKDFFKGSDRFS